MNTTETLECRVGNTSIPAKNHAIYPQSVNEILGVVFPLKGTENSEVYTQPEEIRYF